jgi:hypothetical protein
MSKGLKNKIGKWTYADGARAEKSFGGRHFTVVIAGAEVAGITAAEYNGIVIYDDNLRTQIMEYHVREASGYDGPSRRQLAEVQRILAMNWNEFTSFLKSSPNYARGSLRDIDAAVPLTFKPEKDRMIFPPSAKIEDCPYEFPLETKREIIDFLCNHQMKPVSRRARNQSLAWDIKVHDFDTSGRTEGYNPDAEFDERWRKHVEKNYDALFWEVAADQLRQFTEKEYTIYPGVGAGDYEFSVGGRSGGWLLLSKVKGLGVLNWPWMGEMEADLGSWSDDDLIQFYKLVVQIDKDVANPAQAMAQGLSAQREVIEDAWKAETAPSSAKR